MALSTVERGGEQFAGLQASILVVPKTPIGFPELGEALAPPHMQATLKPFKNPEVTWKLDHEMRVAVTGGVVHDRLGNSKGVRLATERAGIAHDCFQAGKMSRGKIVAAPERVEVLNKAGIYIEEDWKVIKPHPEQAGRYLAHHGEIGAAIQAENHHGIQGPKNSYPREIDVVTFVDKKELRTIAIFAAVDTADALFNPRPYPKWEMIDGNHVLLVGSTREPWEKDRVEEELTRKFSHILSVEAIKTIVQTSQENVGRPAEQFSLAA